MSKTSTSKTSTSSRPSSNTSNSPKTFTPRKPREQRRAEIARMALQLAAERGAGAVSTQSIADALGVSQATVFRHFSTRDEVFREAFAIVRTDVHAALSPVFEDKTRPAIERLRRLVSAHLAFVQDNRGIPAVLFSDSLHGGDPALKGAVRDLMKGYGGRVAGLVLAGVEDGSVSRDADPALIGQAFVTLIQGAVLRWSLFDHAFDLQSQADVIWALLGPALEGVALEGSALQGSAKQGPTVSDGAQDRSDPSQPTE